MADINLDDVNKYLGEKQALIANPGASAAMYQPPPPPTPNVDQGPSLADVQKYLAMKQQSAPQAQAPQQPQAPMGGLESLARGAEQGATMDFAPRINAGIQALGGADYDKALADERVSMQRAQSSHPYLYGAGNIAGSVAPLAIPGVGEAVAGEGILGAAKAGALMGGVSGVGQSADLSDLPDVAQNAVSGAASGAAIGGAIGGAKDVLSPFTNQIGKLSSNAYNAVSNVGPFPGMADAFSQGLSNGNLWGEQPHTDAARGLITQIKSAGQTIQQALNGAAQDQRGALGQQASIDLTPWIKDVYTAGINGQKATAFGENRDAINQVLDLVNEFVDNRGTNVTPLQANELKRQIGMLGTEGNDAMTNPVGRQFANRIISPLKHSPNEIESSFGLPDDFSSLKDTINDSVDGLSGANQRINKLLLAQDMIPDINTLSNSEKATTGGASASDKLQDFFGALPDDIRQQIQPGLESAAKTKAVADKINAGGLNKGALSLAETGRGALLGTSNWAGASMNAVGQAASDTASDYANGGIGSLFKSMYNQSPQAFNTVGSQLVNMGGTAGDIGKALVGASQKDNFGRNAIIFALSQNPAYRNEIEKHFGNGVGIDMKQPAGQTAQLKNNNY